MGISRRNRWALNLGPCLAVQGCYTINRAHNVSSGGTGLVCTGEVTVENFRTQLVPRQLLMLRSSAVVISTRIITPMLFANVMSRRRHHSRLSFGTAHRPLSMIGSSSFVGRRSSFVGRQSSSVVVGHLSWTVDRLSKVVIGGRRQSSVVGRHSSVFNGLSSFVWRLRHSSVVKRYSSVVCLQSSVVGRRPAVIRCRCSVGCRSSVINVLVGGCRPLVVNHRSSVVGIGRRLSVVGRSVGRSSVVDRESSVVGCRSLVVGRWSSVVCQSSVVCRRFVVVGGRLLVVFRRSWVVGFRSSVIICSSSIVSVVNRRSWFVGRRLSLVCR